MPTVTWVGGTSTNVATGANWSGGSVPGAGDTAVWNSVTTYNMSGTLDNEVFLIVTDGAGWGTTTISRDVGTSASPLSFKSTGTTSTGRFGNRGNVYITGNTVVSVAFEMPNGGTGVLSGGTWTTVYATGVNVEIGASAVVTNLKNNGSTVAAATNGTGITLLTGTGRTTCTTRNITTAVLSGPAIVTVEGTTTTGTVYVGTGSTFVHKSSGTTTTAEIFSGGKYTAAGSNATAATLTTANIHKGSTLVEVVPGFTLTVTNKNYVGGQSTGADLP